VGVFYISQRAYDYVLALRAVTHNTSTHFKLFRTDFCSNRVMANAISLCSPSLQPIVVGMNNISMPTLYLLVSVIACR